MKAVIQRVTHASVTVDGTICGAIDNGFLVLLGVCPEDDRAIAEKLADKIAKMRIFCDENDKMNRSLLDFKDSTDPYAMLVVSQFTLCADTRRGNRPDFFGAAKPDKAEPLYEYFSDYVRKTYGLRVENGVFGADMKVELLNDGPVTIVIDTDDWKKPTEKQLDAQNSKA